MVFDWDDHHQGNDALPRLRQLRALRPDFRCTLFAVPGLGSPDFWANTPSWVELAVHGWEHPDPHECTDWTAFRMWKAILNRPFPFVQGFKAPGWQISDGCYEALAGAQWWVADHPENDARRPEGIRAHVVGGPDHWHGHVQDVCGNGLAETWDHVVSLVVAAPSFELVSEAAAPWRARVAA